MNFFKHVILKICISF